MYLVTINCSSMQKKSVMLITFKCMGIQYSACYTFTIIHLLRIRVYILLFRFINSYSRVNNIAHNSVWRHYVIDFVLCEYRYCFQIGYVLCLYTFKTRHITFYCVRICLMKKPVVQNTVCK